MVQGQRRTALLIGINAYPDKPLYGSVHDVCIMKDYLEGLSVPVEVHQLTATTSTDPSVKEPQEAPSHWPTLENVLGHLEALTELSRPGDFALIHFSGHGTQFPHPRNSRSTRDLGLVLLGGMNGLSVDYLRGHDLADRLQKMVSVGLNVTLVLDCCFSGGVSRDEQENCKFLPYDIEIGNILGPSTAEITDETSPTPTSRDSSMLPNWLVNPDGYSILAACGPHETAREIKLPGDDYASALSYFLFRALSKLGNTDPKIGDIYEHLCSRFMDNSWPEQHKQMPMLYGNKNLSFFGTLISDISSSSIPIFRGGDNQLMLRAGQAHGVLSGDCFDGYPFEWAVNSFRGNRETVKLMVSHAGPLTSVLVGQNGTTVHSDVGKGWNAKGADRPRVSAIPIGLISNPAGLYELLRSGRERNLLFTPQRTIEDTQPGCFCVVAKSSPAHGYDIFAHYTDLVATFSTTSPFDRGPGFQHFMNTLEHLTRFKQIEAIAGASSPYLNSCFGCTVHARGALQNLAAVIHTTNGECLELTIQNTGQKPLYIHIYEMGPLWGVQNIFGGDYDVIPPKDPCNGCTGIATWTLKMKIPGSLMGLCKDILKIFVTDEPTSFSLLTMLPLNNCGSEKSFCEDLKLLPIFQAEAGKGGTRSAVGEWAVMNIQIHTS